ncbi:AraC family transcriptional regulator [Dysgonomonas macrotermitis]|uniref:Transcriptional regulator, AraC family n=1 Tax=Dysgonomonas macrotermitis TaxID=1346286 RepID=A0A1M4X015_9BACT|nr:AraC family transcriptional regulator [Dysgonomonas macrotermitis]SHE86856.1 transcriptional regulator, AraC family [Dysgonomonas macrotermitis]
MIEDNSIHVKYLIANEQDLLWGLTVNTVGVQDIPPGSPYPLGSHPTRYLFSTEKGRILEEYQLLYITQGQGRFTSTSQKPVNVCEGNMFLLFPGEWHTYHPDQSTGWNEYWIGFQGINIDNRIQNGFFSKNKPVFNVGIREEIVQLYKQAIDIARDQHTGFQQMLAGIVNHLLGYAYSQDKYSLFEDLKVTNQINKAKIIMLEHYHTSILPEEVAQRVNMSYSWFRRIFKQYTGFAPAQYILELKIQKSKELLTNTMMTSQEVAFAVGFDNSDYFCSTFKRKTGYTPIKYREFTQGKNL